MHATLRGVDLPDLGVVEARTPAPDLAIALTRGRHPKPYQHVDPNEDVVAVHRAGGRTLLVVADGHSGHQASHAAVDAVLDAAAVAVPTWSRREAVHALHAVNERIREARRPLSGPHRGSRTTLAVAVIALDDDGAPFLTHAAVGDSAVLVVRDGQVHQLTRDRPHFLGDRLTPPLVAGALDYAQTDLEDDDAVVLVTDGYTNFAPIEAVADALADAADPGAAVRQVIDLAGDAGAGDNVAVALQVPVGRVA